MTDTTEETLTTEVIGQRIAIGMGMVYNLFNEMHSLLRLIKQGLQEAEAEIQFRGPKRFMLPMPKTGKTPADSFLSTDMGIIAEIGSTADPDLDEDASEDETVDDDEGTEAVAAGGKMQVAITPDSQFLLIRAILFDPKAINGQFEPMVVAAALSQMTLTPVRKKKAADTAHANFSVAAGALKLLTKTLDGSVEEGQTISVRIPKGRLAATITGIHREPVGTFDSKAAVDVFVEQIASLTAP